METTSKIQIKGMVCGRCISVVENEMKALGHSSLKVELGEVTVFDKTPVNGTALEKRLVPLGFQLLEDPKEKIAKEVKDLVAEVYSGRFDFPQNFRFPAFLKERMGREYSAVSDAFTGVERKSIEQYSIEYRISKVKEFLVYSTITLADIAFRLNFNSVPHLSTQFKQYTGLTPSHFKEVKRRKTEVIFSSN
jgi:AraC family transcriptional regulator